MITPARHATGQLARRQLLAGLGLLAGCVPTIPGQSPPPREFRLTAKSTFPAGLPSVGWTLAVAEPEAERALDSDRIAVVSDGLRIDYYAEARWIDRAPSMLQLLVVQSFRNSGRIALVVTDRERAQTDFLLRSFLRAFQTQQRGSAPAVVRVALDATLLRLPRRSPLTSRTFAREQAIAGRGMEGVVTAFDEALGQLLKDLVVMTLSAPVGELT